MMNVIKTAIVTIIISIISGLLVEHFKSLAPRILCNIGRGIPIKLNNKRVYAYKVTISNLSKKIIHELTLNVQSAHSSLRIADAKITKGLKFDSSAKENILDISIPFLGKGDKFSVTIYAENSKKPTIVLRSPENFKEIDSVEKQGVLSSIFDNSKNMNRPTSNIMKKIQAIFGNKKAIIAAVSIVLVVIVGVLVKLYFSSASPSTGTDVNKSAANSSKPTSGTNKNSGTKPSIGGARRRTSTGGTSTNGENTPTNGASGNAGAKRSTGGASTNSSSNTSTNGADKNSNTNNTIDGSASGNSDTKTSTNGSTNTKTSTSGSAGSENTSTGGTAENASK